MKINVKHLAKLANLELSKKQEEDLEKNTPAVITYMDEIKNLDVDGVAETTRVTEEENVWREDIVELSLSQADALRNAKKTRRGFFVVPGIFEE